MKLKERVSRLEANNASLFYRNESFKREFTSLKHDLFLVQDKNEKLKEEQASYEASLRAEVERIQALGDWKRFWGSVKLFANLFKVIQEGFKE